MNEEQTQQLQHEHAHRGEVIKELSHLNGELNTELISLRIQIRRLQEHVRQSQELQE